MALVSMNELRNNAASGAAVTAFMLTVETVPEIREKYAVVDCAGEIDAVKVVLRSDGTNGSPKIPDLSIVHASLRATKNLSKFFVAYYLFVGWFPPLYFELEHERAKEEGERDV